MKKCSIYFALVVLTTFSCQHAKIDNLSFEGDLIAKNVLKVHGELIDNQGSGSMDFRWFLAPTPDGEWERLPGILTDEIVLLTSYTGKYIKCEISGNAESDAGDKSASIISSKPIELKGNPNTDWFRDAGFGIMLHYLKPVIAPDGGADEWNKAVNSFDVEAFANQVKDAKAGFVMFTLGQNSGFYCSPNSAFDKAVGVQPGELCSSRDLPKDLIAALKKYDIPLILYLPSNPPINNKLVSEKLQYSYQKDSATSQFNQPILEDMIREWSTRYGDAVKGWWFDGLYSWNAIRSTRMDMSLEYNISTHTLAAKAGNKHSIVTYNSGFGEIHANTPYDDYTSGEKATIDEFPSGRWAEDGVQWFLFTYLGEKWGGHGQQFETEVLVEKADQIVKNEGVLCLEVVANAKGEILPHHLAQIKAVGRKLGRPSKNELLK